MLEDAPFQSRVVVVHKHEEEPRLEKALAGTFAWLDQRMSIQLGAGPRTFVGIHTMLNHYGVQVEKFGKGILGQVVVAEKRSEIEVVFPTVGDLVGPNGATLSQAFSAAESFGCEPIPCEGGHQLRIKHVNQPSRDFLFVGMTPVTVEGSPMIYRLSKDQLGRMHLEGHHCRLDRVLGPTVKLALALRK